MDSNQKRGIMSEKTHTRMCSEEHNNIINELMNDFDRSSLSVFLQFN